MGRGDLELSQRFMFQDRYCIICFGWSRNVFNCLMLSNIKYLLYRPDKNYIIILDLKKYYIHLTNDRNEGLIPIILTMETVK